MEAENSGDHLSRAARDVYLNCDVSSENSVTVSILLRFINSSDWANVFEFTKLEAMLDPHGTDPCITCEEFMHIVTEWANSNDTHFGLETQSPPPICNGTHHSPASEYVRTLELKYQNSIRKIEDLKLQLAAAEEQNDLLQIESEGIAPKFPNRTEVKEAEDERADVADCVAELKSLYDNQIFKLKKSVEFYEKEITALNETIAKQTEEKKHLEEKIEIFDQKLKDQTKAWYNLEAELESKEKSITSLFDSNCQLQAKLNRQEEYINHYSEVINILEDDKKVLEDSVQEHIPECSLYTMQLNCTPQRSLNSDANTPLTCKIFKYNSPRLLYNLQNPVSPNLDSPRVDKINNNDTENPIESCDCTFTSDTKDISDSGESKAEIFNITDESLANTLRLLCNGRRRDSLSDEILLADQDFHRNECLQIISRQKSQILDLEESIEQMNAQIEQLTEQRGENQLHIATLTLTAEEQTERCTTLLEQLQAGKQRIEELTAKNELLEKLARPQCASCDEVNGKSLRMTNFSKMEVKLERREVMIEELRKLLKFEKVNYEKLLNERNSLEQDLNVAICNGNKLIEEVSMLNRKRDSLQEEYVIVRNEVLMLKSDYARFRESTRAILAEFNSLLATLPIEILKFKFESLQSKMISAEFDCSELDHLSNHISNQTLGSDVTSKLLPKVISAFKCDSETIESRLQTQATLGEEAQRVLLDLFENVKLVLTSVETHLSTKHKLLSHQLVENCPLYITNAVNVTIQYGKLLREHSQLKLLGVVVNQNRHLDRQISRYKQLNTRSTEKLSHACCKIGICFCVFFLIAFTLLVSYLIISGNLGYIYDCYFQDCPTPI
uniref:Uncharacterized protein n=1 Tax=Photinus pyralis TaxID=7054 RepID=A0A1Y1K4Y4_PHOPY